MYARIVVRIIYLFSKYANFYFCNDLMFSLILFATKTLHANHIVSHVYKTFWVLDIKTWNVWEVKPIHTPHEDDSIEGTICSVTCEGTASPVKIPDLILRSTLKKKILFMLHQPMVMTFSIYIISIANL
jgi:hypothetical protein